MRKRHLRMVTGVALLCLGLMNASPIAAQGNGNGNGRGSGNVPGNGGGNSDFGLVKSPNLAQTPELGSLALFGTGVAGVAGYALLRMRAGRRQDDNQESGSRT